ncbi:MAG: metallophosphoesterase family protein [Hamadaea sp.]|nr:metallophosphoesterase family protein [Hamadaea sp.]
MSYTLHGPWPGEGPAPRLGPFGRVAVLADVHGNVPALTAVLAEPDVQAADLVVFCGDLTWGAEPDRTVEAVRALGPRALCVRGNADRAVVELARRGRDPSGARDTWMLSRHSPASVEFVAAFPFNAVVDVAGLGAVRFCHGSCRSDTEVLTPGTPDARLTEVFAAMDEHVLASGHTHLQFDRTVDGNRNVNAGSVGLPYHLGEPGTAYWALFGPEVGLRQTRYDLEAAVAAATGIGDPREEVIVGLLTRPPTPDEVIAHAEGLVFTD